MPPRSRTRAATGTADPAAKTPIDISKQFWAAADKLRGQDVLGYIYEYFLGQFASAKVKQGGKFYTPQSVVKVLTGMLAPWKLARMNLAIRRIDANLGPHAADTFHHDLHPDLKADYILANPPFNISDWGDERVHDDHRWALGTPPVTLRHTEV